MNTRHISLFNEFKIVAGNTGGTISFNVDKNINCISLNNGMRYSIKNLSVDIGSSSSVIGVQETINSFPVFPLRFYLSDNPIVDAFFSGYTIGSIKFNGVSSPTAYNYSQLDRADSSNQSAYCDPKSYYNYLQTEQTDSQGNFSQTQLKTNTVAEYNFFNSIMKQTNTFNSSTLLNDPTFLSEFSNNDISDFYFNSNQENNLAISIFPRINMNTSSGLGTGQNISLYLSYTINFDLIEEGF
jgi:hypothetical protein